MKIVQFRCSCNCFVTIEIPTIKRKGEGLIEYLVFRDQWKQDHKNHNWEVSTNFTSIGILEPIISAAR